MKSTFIRLGLLAIMISALASCGGSGGGGDAAVNSSTITSAMVIAANDTSINSSAPFTVMQDAGIPPVTVNTTPKVNFTVFSDGAVKQGLTTANMSFAIAKLVPGTSGNPDQWVNYIYKTETATAGVGPGGVAAMASAVQATTDSKVATQLVYNPDGYYTYTFSKDITDITKTNGVVFEPSRTHRIAIQLSYTNKVGEAVKVNPYFDFTIDANGKAVAVTDPAKTRKMSDVTSCNTCHNKLALHGGGRVDTQFCVMCHNSGTTDANSGNVLDLRTMVHKIHSGRRLAKSATPEDYTIWGYQNSKVDFAEVGFPQDLRNCTKCHSSANANTPQGDNWKNKPTKEACLTCHQTGTGTNWDNIHIAAGYINTLLGSPANAAATSNDQCKNCHSADSGWGAEQVHWNQNEENAAKYKMTIESAVYDSTSRNVTVAYYLADPTNGNAAYDLTTGCTGTPVACTSSNKFGNLKFILAYPTLAGQPTAVTEFSSYNNATGGGTVPTSGSTSNAFAYKGANVGANHYTVTLPVPADTATFVAAGTARVVSYGQVKEEELNVVTRTPKAGPVLINVSVQNTHKDVALSGTLTPRREIVSNDKCNACHSLLGTGSGSNMLTNAFHGGARDTVEACVVCHDPNRMSSTMMADGSSWNEAYQFKRMIHGIHGGTKRIYPFTHGNKAIGAFSKTGFLLSDGTTTLSAANIAIGNTSAVENFTAEVAFPGHLWDCNTCHVNNSYQRDQGTIGAVINKPIIAPATTATTDPLLWKVASPKAASCTACHDSSTAQSHVTFMGASFGTKNQGEYLNGGVNEQCDSCHAPGVTIGSIKTGVDIAHGLK